eukprot:3467765-Prymnesium_polylepis.2
MATSCTSESFLRRAEIANSICARSACCCARVVAPPSSPCVRKSAPIESITMSRTGLAKRRAGVSFFSTASSVSASSTCMIEIASISLPAVAPSDACSRANASASTCSRFTAGIKLAESECRKMAPP